MSNGARRLDWVELAIGMALLGLAAVIWLDAAGLAPGSIYGFGPSVAPRIIAIGLVLLGGATAIKAVRVAPGDLERADWGAVGVALGGLLALIVLIAVGGGFIVASTVLFAATSWAFGRRALFADLAVGLIIAAAIYLVFTRLLTLGLPQGPLERLL